jgi:hypothetical protein
MGEAEIGSNMYNQVQIHQSRNNPNKYGSI